MIEKSCVSCAWRVHSDCHRHVTWCVQSPDVKRVFKIFSIKTCTCDDWEIKPGFMGSREDEMKMLEELYGEE